MLVKLIKVYLDRYIPSLEKLDALFAQYPPGRQMAGAVRVLRGRRARRDGADPIHAAFGRDDSHRQNPGRKPQ